MDRGSRAATTSEPAARPRQPAALTVLGIVEIGDRFAYYALFSVFLLYLTEIRHLAQADAFLILGVFSSLASLTTLAGGVAADHVFGFGRSIIFGAVLLIAGFAGLAWDGGGSLSLALALIAVGNGLTTANIPALLGQFYGEDDARRTAGFTYLYMTINIGAMLGMLAMGLVANRFGYPAAFAMAGGAKLVSLIAYLAGRRWLRAHDGLPTAAPGGTGWRGAGGLAVFAIVAATALLLAFPADTGWVLLLVAAVALGICLTAFARGDDEFRRRLLILLLLVSAAIVFWAIYRQFAGSVLMFTEVDTDRTILEWNVPASELTALNPALVLAVGPLAAWLWTSLAKRRLEVHDYLKFALGLVFAGLSFLLLSLGVFTTPTGAKDAILWIVLFQLVLAVGEICLAPVGLALTSKLAPRSLAGSAMGIWYLSTAFAFYLSGVIAEPLAAHDGTAEAVQIYGYGFAVYGAAGLGVGILFALFAPRLRRLAPA